MVLTNRSPRSAALWEQNQEGGSGALGAFERQLGHLAAECAPLLLRGVTAGLRRRLTKLEPRQTSAPFNPSTCEALGDALL